MPGKPTDMFGKQLRRERLARGWSLEELSKRTGIAMSHLSRIENGKRPPTEKIAVACDSAMPDRRGYFVELHQEMSTWLPPGFRDWPELESKATVLQAWSPGVIDGLLQTADYAAAMLATLPGADDNAVKGRLASRVERQRRVLMRDDPPVVRVIVDELALYRRVCDASVMIAQLDRVAEVASLPRVTVQVLPAREHPATASGFVLADDAAYIEHVLGGGTYVDDLSVSTLANLFDALRTECYGATESMLIIRKAMGLWTSESRATAVPRADRASR
jgi:uncharacterized protein DUF5753/helix-turn-helix protein